MARKIYSRLKIKGALVTETPLHIGGFGESPDTDLPLAQNGKGEWYVPGTSIAGVLRGWCEKNFEKSPIDSLITKLFGPKREKGKEEGHASFVLIEDAKVTLPDGLTVEIRDGVGIDRFYGTAADGAKFDRAVLPRGSKLDFQLSVEIEKQTDADRIKALLGHLLEALQKKKVRFGAARTRGLGRVRLEAEEIKEQELIGFDAILNLLKDGGNSLSISDLKNADSNTKASDNPHLEITIIWKPRLPVMVKAGYDGIGVDILPLTSGVDGNKLALVLPGSSIKGTLRSHAERIIRTVLDCESKTDFHDQIEVPLVEELFGARNKSNSTKGLGALAIDDCYAQETYAMDVKQWREVEIAVDAKKKESEQEKGDEVSYFRRELWKKLREVDEGKESLFPEQYEKETNRFRINHHVAIDRWTGGAAEGALYSVLAPTGVEWDAMRLTLDFARLSEDEKITLKLPALMLLLLTLRDIAESRLPFGFATNRAMGEIEVTEINFDGSNLDHLGLSQPLKVRIENGKFKFEGNSQTITERWKEWRDKSKTNNSTSAEPKT